MLVPRDDALPGSCHTVLIKSRSRFHVSGYILDYNVVDSVSSGGERRPSLAFSYFIALASQGVRFVAHSDTIRVFVAVGAAGLCWSVLGYGIAIFIGKSRARSLR